MIHHVQAHLIPSWVGTDLRWTYEFSNSNQLILTAAFDEAPTDWCGKAMAHEALAGPR